MFVPQQDNQSKAPSDPASKPREAEPVSDAQRSNPVWQSLALRRAGIQPKLSISQPNDPSEQEADRVADRVVGLKPTSDQPLSLSSSPTDEAQRRSAPCGEGQEKLQRKVEPTGETAINKGADSAKGEPGLPTKLESSKGGGQPLADSTRREMESRMGADLSGVRVHTGTAAHEMNEEINARAFTRESDIYFSEGEFNPHSTQGKHLLAHELAHSLQPGPTRQILQRQENPKSSVSGNNLLTRWDKYLDSKEWIKERKILASNYVQSRDLENIGAALAQACIVKNATFKHAFGDIGLEILDQLSKNDRGDVSLIAASKLTDQQLQQATPALLVSMHAAIEGGWSTKAMAHFPSQKLRIRNAIPIAYINSAGPLTPEEINIARTFIARNPDLSKQAEMYEKLQQKPAYQSQRDNQYEQQVTEKGQTKKVRIETAGGNMCNLTSLAMSLSYLGIPNPYPVMQYEDALEKIRVDNKYPARSDASGWGKVAEYMGVDHEIFAWNVKQGKAWYEKNVEEQHLRKGHAVMMSITGHIVRIQAVTEAGLVVDDPYGKSKLDSGKKRSFTTINKSEWQSKKEGASNEGEDNVWSWDAVKAHSMLWIAYFIRK
jgi:hypothetical protein